MSKSKIIVRSAKERRIAQIPVDKIDVSNPRKRDEERFKEMVKNISVLGLYKPICVNERNLKKTGRYELVCGEGRLKAYQQNGMTHIDAEIINVDEAKALLMGLAENLTRTRKDIIDLARRLLRMREQGMSFADLAQITGKSQLSMRNYIELMQKGEERLIRGVEDDRFTMDFALKVLQCPGSEVQNFLLDEYENGRISTRDLDYIRRILKEREAKGLSNTDMTHTKLSIIIRDETKKQKLLYAQRKIKRNDALYLMECLESLWGDEKFNQMIGELKDLMKPEIKGQYEN